VVTKAQHERFTALSLKHLNCVSAQYFVNNDLTLISFITSSVCVAVYVLDCYYLHTLHIPLYRLHPALFQNSHQNSVFQLRKLKIISWRKSCSWKADNDSATQEIVSSL
jgi:hypothetical protein